MSLKRLVVIMRKRTINEHAIVIRLGKSNFVCQLMQIVIRNEKQNRAGATGNHCTRYNEHPINS